MWRRLIAPFIALIIGGSVALSPGCSKNPGEPSPAAQVVAFGDSLTFGTGTTGDNHYVAVLSRRLGGDIHNAGLVGLGRPPLEPFDGALPALASGTGSTYVPDILEGIFGVPSLMADSLHPNNAGHAIMADRLEPALRVALAAIPQNRF